ncbi:TPA: sugar phosphate isomerase/epimerase [Candidatus Woesearchaeota archaeon]|nr:sugar phosphate isomerase/epimerase [Candidatus Woesearchaeota archaeon]HIH92050.1 sugar phosphate isomerase/epimerase [Candidatus Woesearchaeota archaeon]HII64802.1 sugar phosphate isomerase/epimerase [Candidatus Woesearchaeota archaeon]HII66014.1 sugar phosphate isomerase/epimerase [Candidatus Woesearchaeota archaeon]HIJ18809.1 sugar phosphate isomerase/epimerase [Candidatus Woesearchaeota archaeon]
MSDFGRPLYGHHPALDYFAPPSNAMEPSTYGQQDSYATPDLGVDRIGMSVPLGIAANNVAGIYSKIRMGAGSLEIQFPGHGGGRPNAQTPEQYGKDQRTALRELADINEVNLTTHASFAMSGMTGYDGREYNIKNAQKNLEELKTAIDFQADVAEGGSVVMHAGEFERPITEMYLDDETGTVNLARDPSGRLMFRQYNRQEGTSQFTLIDDRTHQVSHVQRDRLMSYPDWLTAEKDNPHGMDEKGKPCYIKAGDYVDYEGRKLTDPYNPLTGRVPKYDQKNGTIIVELRDFEFFRGEAEKYNKHMEEELNRPLRYDEKVYPEEMMARSALEVNQASQRGYLFFYGRDIPQQRERIDKLLQAKEFYTKLENDPSLSPEARERLKREQPLVHGGLAPPEMKFPSEIIEEQIKELRRSVEFSSATSYGTRSQILDLEEAKNHLISPIKRLEREGVRLYAEAGIHAMQRTKDPDAPVTVAIEHIFPEQFGGHPEELKWIISKSRERMVELLTSKSVEFGASEAPTEWGKERQKLGGKGEELRKQPNPFYTGMSREEAEKLAEKHIKATIDTGHINMWRKYWQPDMSKTPEENDRLFKEWAVKSIESLAKEKMVGNVHLADNLGYHDDHLAPGQGNSPVREIMNVIRKYGYDRAITVEPGADATSDQGDFWGLMKTWRFFGSPVYGMGGGSQSRQGWGDIHSAYFGQGRPPNYIFGAYAPSNEWQLWSQVPLE